MTACGSGGTGQDATAAPTTRAAAAGETVPVPSTSSTASTTTSTTAVPDAGAPRPAWLGTRLLPLRPDGFGEIQPTPAELDDRRLRTPDVLPPPPDGAYRSTIAAVPDDVVARSTWTADCPVALADLRYVTVTFWGFDERPHTGELLVHASAAEPLVRVFERLHAARFPIEEMRVVRTEELDLHPTGDGNNTSAFVCRPTRGSSSWSQHAYGLALDVNPFHNPYVKGDIVLPELASSYVDRSRVRPGMVLAGDPVTEAFAAIGWGWGGTWSSFADTMHFSANGR